MRAWTTDISHPGHRCPGSGRRSYPRSRRWTASRRSGSPGGRPRTPTPSTGPPRCRPRGSRSGRSTLPRRRPAARCTSATSSATPTPTSSPATSGCAASTSSTRWAGTTTACPPSAGCRTTTASAATRRCPTTRRSPRRRSPARTRSPVSRRNFVELCMQLTEEDEARLRAAVAPGRAVGGLVGRLPDDLASPPAPPRSGCSCTTSPAARPTPRRRRPSGTSPSGPRSPRPSSRTASAPAPTTGSASPAARAPVYIETTRPELLPACVALVAHPDDERYQPLFGKTVRTPLFDVEVPVVAHRLAEPDKGSGIAMICTFGDLNDVTWWRELQLPTRPIVGWDGRILADPPPGVPAPALRRAGRQDRVQRPAAHRRAAARVRRPGRRAEADHPPGEVLREGRAPAGDRHHAAVVHPQRRPGRRPARRAGRARPGDPVGARAHAAPLRELGRGPQRRLADQPAAVLRRPVPGLVPAGRRAASRTTTTRSWRRRPSLPVDPSSDVPGGLHRDPARQAGRLHGRPRRHGHLGDVVAVAAGRLGLGHRPGAVRARLPDGPAAAGARHHPHLAVLHRRPLALRVRRGAVVARHDLRLRRRPRPQEDVEVEGQRDDADRRPGAVRHRRRPLAGRRRAAGRGLAVRRGADEGRPPAGDQDPQRRQVRARASGASAGAVRRRRSPSRSTAALLADAGRRRRRGHRRVRGLQLHAGARGRGVVLLVVLRRLRRAGEVAGLPLGRRGGVRAGHAGDRAVGAAAAVRAGAAVRHRGGLVVVAGGLGAPRAVAGGRRAARRR